MAVNQNTDTGTGNRKDKLETQIKCFQINLRHSRVATDNIVKLTAEYGTDILLLQEPYIIQNNIVAIPKKHKTLAHGGR